MGTDEIEEEPNPEELQAAAAEVAYTRSGAYSMPAGEKLSWTFATTALAQKAGWNLIMFGDEAFDESGRLITCYPGFLQDLQVVMWAASRGENEVDSLLLLPAFLLSRNAREWFENLGIRYGDDDYVQLQTTFIDMMTDYFVSETEPIEDSGPPEKGEASQ